MGITSFCQRAARPRRRPCRIILLFYHRPPPSATGKEKRFAGAGGRCLSRYIADLIASAWVLIQLIEWFRMHKKKRAVCYQPPDGSLTEENSSAVQSLAAATASGFHTLIIIRFLPPVKGVCFSAFRFVRQFRPLPAAGCTWPFRGRPDETSVKVRIFFRSSLSARADPSTMPCGHGPPSLTGTVRAPAVPSAPPCGRRG